MKNLWTMIAVLVVTCGLVVPAEAQLKLRKSGKFSETHVFSFTLDSGGTRSDKLKLQVSAADLQNVFNGSNPRIVISLNVTQS